LKIKQGDDMAKAKETSQKKTSTEGADKTAAKKPAAKRATKTAAKSDAAAEAGQSAANHAEAKAASAEPVAESPAGPSELEGAQLPATQGKAGLLGGPKDRGIKPDDKLALPTGPHFVYERVRSLNPKSFYCAMRWDYRFEHKSPEEGKRWWANKKLLVTNPKTGVAVVVRAVDYGPHENTGLEISLSPGAAEALGIEVGDEVSIAFADQKAHLGVVE
jgi:hypothetical protein